MALADSPLAHDAYLFIGGGNQVTPVTDPVTDPDRHTQPRKRVTVTNRVSGVEPPQLSRKRIAESKMFACIWTGMILDLSGNASQRGVTVNLVTYVFVGSNPTTPI